MTVDEAAKHYDACLAMAKTWVRKNDRYWARDEVYDLAHDLWIDLLKVNIPPGVSSADAFVAVALWRKAHGRTAGASRDRTRRKREVSWDEYQEAIEGQDDTEYNTKGERVWVNLHRPENAC